LEWSVINNNDTQVVVDAKNSNISLLQTNGDIVLTSNSGSVISKASAWIYLVVSPVSVLFSNIGTIGTKVNITGINLLGGGNFTVNHMS
jgi:hypothetical protein